MLVGVPAGGEEVSEVPKMAGLTEQSTGRAAIAGLVIYS